jgi:dTMP kinase
LRPDLTILFDVSPATGRKRTVRKSKPDRFERERDAYFERVRTAYLRRARADAGRVRVVDAHGTLPQVKKELENIISRYC